MAAASCVLQLLGLSLRSGGGGLGRVGQLAVFGEIGVGFFKLVVLLHDGGVFRLGLGELAFEVGQLGVRRGQLTGGFRKIGVVRTSLGPGGGGGALGLREGVAGGLQLQREGLVLLANLVELGRQRAGAGGRRRCPGAGRPTGDLGRQLLDLIGQPALVGAKVVVLRAKGGNGEIEAGSGRRQGAHRRRGGSGRRGRRWRRPGLAPDVHKLDGGAFDLVIEAAVVVGEATEAGLGVRELAAEGGELIAAGPGGGDRQRGVGGSGSRRPPWQAGQNWS